MSAKQLLILGAAVLMSFLSGGARTGETQHPVVRIAELEIDPAQLESYKAVVKEEIDTSVRVEPGVLAMGALHNSYGGFLSCPRRVLLL